MKKILVLAGMLAMAVGVFAGKDSPLPVSIVHAKVMRDFILRFDEVSFARWLPDRNGSSMYFIKDGFHNRAAYDLSGRWQYSIVNYDEARMPKDVRTVVKRQYFDFSILVVQEVRTPDGMAYFIHLQDQDNFKVVRVDSELNMETMQEFHRQ
jgi:hypothetical protein